MNFGGLSLALASGLLLSTILWSGWCVLRALPPGPASRRSRVAEACWRTGAFLVIFGAHLGYVHHYATPIPFYDQWSAEGKALILPFLEGTLHWGELVAAHNEHRITTHRIWTLLLLVLNGQWDNLWQTTANGLLLAWTGSLLAVVLLRLFPGWGGWLTSLLGVLLFALPMGWSNVIFGFQAQFYFMQYFGLAALVLLICGTSRVSWVTGWGCLVLAYLSLSGAILLALALVPVFLCRAVWERERRGFALRAALVALAVCVTGLLLVPTVAGHQSIRPDSMMRFLESLVRNLAWPWIDRRVPWWETAWVIPLLWAPLTVLLVLLVAARDEALRTLRRSRGLQLLVAFGGWSFFTVVAVAYTRGGLEAYGFSWRYNDIFRFGLLANALAFVLLVSRWWRTGLIQRSGLVLVGFVIAATWGWGLMVHNREALDLWLPRFERFGGYQVERVSTFLRTGDESVLRQAPEFHRPYPDTPTLVRLLENPQLQEVLPWSIRLPLSGRIGAVEPAVFRLGAQPETVVDRPGERIWSNYCAETGGARRGSELWLSSRPPSQPFVVVPLAGAPHRPDLGLYTRPREGDPFKISRSGAGDRWLERRVFVGAGESLVLEAVSATETHWFAFAEPREMSAVSFYTIWIGKEHRLLAGTGMALLLAATGLVASCGFPGKRGLDDY